MRHHHSHHHRWRRHRKGWSKHHRRHWLLTRGIHRRLALYILLAVVLGLVAGWALHGAHSAGWTGTSWCLGASVIAFTWPLGWWATFRIARPVRELARVAGELRDGKLKSREHLADGADEVGEVAGALHDLSGRIADQLDAQRALMAAVSHELRSPLARVRVLVELMREGNAPDGSYDDLQAEVDGMDALVGDLLAGARIDFEAVSPVDVDARDICARALSEAGYPSELLDVRGNVAEVRADPTLLVRALGVLLDNAERYGGGPTELVIEAGDDGVRFAVLDEGPGFQDGEEEQVFQPFWRRAGTTSSGAGLGLALVRQIARAHGGEAGAENRPEGGARVWMEL